MHHPCRRLAGLSAAVGAPRRAGFLECATLASFVRLHPVSRTDSFLSLAVRYGVHPTAVKRVNGMISDHSLHSRLEVFVPVARAEQLAGRQVEVRYCCQAKRDVAVLVEGGGGGGGGAAAASAGSEEAAVRQAEALRLKLSQLLGRSLHVDQETAVSRGRPSPGDEERAELPGGVSATPACWCC
jgi:hypothetical protein